MPRVMGVDIPGKKRVEYSLRYIYGVGPSRARDLVAKARIDAAKKADDLTDEEVTRLASLLQELVLEGDLRREVQGNIRRLISIGCYRGRQARKILFVNKITFIFTPVLIP